MLILISPNSVKFLAKNFGYILALYQKFWIKIYHLLDEKMYLLMSLLLSVNLKSNVLLANGLKQYP